MSLRCLKIISGMKDLNHAHSPVLERQRWSIQANESYKLTENCHYNQIKTKAKKYVHTLWDIQYIS